MKINRQKTLVLIKPDGVERGLIGEVIRRFENRGIKIIALKMIEPSKKMGQQHYGDVAERYGSKIAKNLIDYMTEGPVVAMAIEGVEAIRVVRGMAGTTYPNESAPGTIRGDYCHISKEYANENEVVVRNVIHASADEADAKRELALWFKKEEYVSYKRVEEIHIW